MTKSFKVKIFVMFALLAVVLSFFSIYFVYSKYQESLEASTRVLSAKTGKMVSRFIHEVQIERGLSAGYIPGKAIGSNQEELKEQYRKTDAQIQEFRRFSQMNSRAKKHLKMLLRRYNAAHVKHLNQLLKQLDATREAIQKRQIDFEATIHYYNAVIKELLDMFYSLHWLTGSQYAYGLDMYRLEMLKEHAALERAYIYNLLLMDHYYLREISTIRYLIQKQEEESKVLLFNLNDTMKERYRTIIKDETMRQVEQMRQVFFQYRLTSNDARRWFEISSERIDELERLSIETSDGYLAQMQAVYHHAQKYLYIIVVLGILAFVAFIFLIYFLNRLLGEIEKLVEDLRIASFAFESHEAMAVTDTEGVILRVNKAFSRITGYAPEEVVGQKTNILKSGQHPEAFYVEMWQKLIDQGHWRGEIRNMRKNGEKYIEQLSITAIKDRNGKTTHYISQFLDITDLKNAEAEARHQATHDFLTQLPNRSSMLQKLKEEYSRAHRHHFFNAFLFADLDDFKKVNDVYGHAVGDKLLIEVARRLKENIREEDYAARISGDEFCVILLDIGTDEHEAAAAARAACTQLLDHLDQPYHIDNLTLTIGISIGIKLFPDENDQIEEIISSADTAMYQAKDKGKNRFVFFDREIEEHIRELTKMENELRAALEGDEIVFFFQPKLDVMSDRIVGAELLVRWNHPERGLLYPHQFLEALGNISMMPRLSEMALNTACQFLVDNAEAFRGTLSINITVHELRTDLFVQMTQETIRRHGVDPARIEIEILENDLIEDFDAVISRMNALREFGVKFSIDDFGIGYSSINYLYTLPVDTLKIDRDFVVKLDDPKTQELVKVIIQLAKVFGLKTILEGVDEEYQLAFARQHGASMYQGYYFSKPMDEKTFGELLRNGRKLLT